MEKRNCDVIVLIRDAYGKYAWEASGIFNDFDSEKEIAEMVKNTANIIDNSKCVSKGQRNTFGSMRQDMIARSAQKSQILAQQTGFHQNSESKTSKEDQLEMDKNKSYSALVNQKLVDKNESKSSAAYWSAKYIEANRVSIKTHVGFKANLTDKDCDKFRYYSDSISGELAYIIPSELKADLSFERKKALYLSSCIRIIWSETGKDSKNAPIWLSQQYIPTQRHSLENTPLIYIRITAQSHGLYRVSINGESVLPYLLGQYKKGGHKKDKHRRKDKGARLKLNKTKQIISKIGAAHTNTTSIPTTGFERVIIGPLVDGMVIMA